MPENGTQAKIDKLTRLLALLLVGTGIGLRLFIYLQNRNLIIDEANVARNINERGFVELLSPLSYQQYAPPVFLWVTKLSSKIFGMGELALRIYPLLCGIASVILFYKVLKKLLPIRTIWYPLGLLVFAAIFIRYSSELKQYSSDVFIALLLVWLALKTEMKPGAKPGFIWMWVIAGSIAVWASMPSVFILAGVGMYYGWLALNEKRFKDILVLCGISVVWLAQFAAYYLLMLKEQANSGYLQSFHHYDFLFATPSKTEEWNHNWYVFSALIRQFEGVYSYVHDINTAFLICGIIMLGWKQKPVFFLLLTPVLGLCFAAAIDQYSMLPRVALFIIPVIILIISFGFAQYSYLKSAWLKSVIVIAGIYVLGCNIANMVAKPYKYEQLTEGMAFMKEKKIPAAAISIYHSSVPAFIYYTTIHPAKQTWAEVKDADRLGWNVHYDSLGWQMRHVWSSRQPLGFLYTNCTEAEFKLRNDGIAHHLQLLDKIDRSYIKAYVYIKPGEPANKQ